jgi:small-conductance mechanosensitive channel
MAEVTVHVPLDADLRAVVDALAEEDAEVYVSALGDGGSTVAVRRWVGPGEDVEREESDLRLGVYERLRTLGVLA